MDDKIKQLLKQAEAHEILDTRGFANRYHYAMTQASIEKFVSLIVEEACQALNPTLRDQISRGHAVDLIKKHFGVEL